MTKITVADRVFNEQLTLDLITDKFITYFSLGIGSLLILVLGYYGAKVIKKFISELLRRTKVDEVIISFISNASYVVVIGVAVIAALSNVGFQTASLAAILGAISVAIGLAFQNSMSNFSAGLLILFLQPFKKGDYIECANTEGVIESINSLVVTLKTGDNKVVIVPNSKIIQDVIVNYSTEETRRMDLTFAINYKDSIEKVKSILTTLVNDEKDFHNEPEVKIFVDQLKDQSVIIAVRPWVNNDIYWDVYARFIQAVKEEFDKAQLHPPITQYEVLINNSSK